MGLDEIIDDYEEQVANAEKRWKLEKQVLQEEYAAARKLKGKMRARKVRELHNRYLQWTQNKKEAMEALTTPFKDELHMLKAARHAHDVHESHRLSKENFGY